MIWWNQIKYPPPSNAWYFDEKRVDIINNPHNLHKVRCSINLYWKWVVRSSVLYKYKNKCLPLLKTAVFQGFSRATSIPSWLALRRAHGTMCLHPTPPRKKSKRRHPRRFLVKFPRMGNAIEVKCPTYARGPPPPSGLTLIGAKWVRHINKCLESFQA